MDNKSFSFKSFKRFQFEPERPSTKTDRLVNETMRLIKTGSKGKPKPPKRSDVAELQRTVSRLERELAQANERNRDLEWQNRGLVQIIQDLKKEK